MVYTVEMAEFIFVLHAFQKKSKSGIATPKIDIDTIKRLWEDKEGKKMTNGRILIFTHLFPLFILFYPIHPVKFAFSVY